MACDQSWRLLPVGRPILLTTDLLTPYKRMHADTVAASVLDPRLHTHALVLLSIDPCMHENHSAPTALLRHVPTLTEKEKKLKIARPPAANTRYTKKEEGKKEHFLVVAVCWRLLLASQLMKPPAGSVVRTLCFGGNDSIYYTTSIYVQYSVDYFHVMRAHLCVVMIEIRTARLCVVFFAAWRKVRG
jgi:hypothetical protein